MDRHHVPADRGRRQLGLLRRRRHVPEPGPVLPAEPRGGTPPAQNPLPSFTTVHEQNTFENIQTHEDFFAAVEDGTLPTVSWMMPSGRNSEHPGNGAPLTKGRRTSRASSTRSRARRCGTGRRSSSRGTTGAGSTTTSSRRASTRTATGSGCPA